MSERTGSSDAAPEGEHSGVHSDALLGVTVAGRYRVVRLVARGGMGRIYLAEQLPLGRSVALKVLEARAVQREQDPEFERRFLLEAATCARLTHPNTVKVYDYGPLNVNGEDTFYMAMEFIEGKTLRQALKAEGHLTPSRALRIAREVARSLREAHRAGVIHRDLKPSNVMLARPPGEEESVKVVDFGIAKVLDNDVGDLTMSGKFLGSPRYMSPEVIRHGAVDHRADLYALGVLLYEMLGGRAPFQGEKAVHTMMMHVNDAPPSIFERTGVTVPPQAEQIALACLAKRPDERPPDAEAVIAMIDAALSTGAPAPLEVTPDEAVDLPPPKRLPWAIAALTAVVAGVAIAVALRPSPAPDAPPAQSGTAVSAGVTHEAPDTPATASASRAPMFPPVSPALASPESTAPLSGAPVQASVSTSPPPRRRSPQPGAAPSKKAMSPALDIRTER